METYQWKDRPRLKGTRREHCEQNLLTKAEQKQLRDLLTEVEQKQLRDLLTEAEQKQLRDLLTEA